MGALLLTRGWARPCRRDLGLLLITILMSWLILGEIPGAAAVLGGAVCLVGVYITRRPANG